jgi:hypothetical protein
VFEYAGLALDGGASYLVAPVWDSLALIPLRIYKDRDRDGTVDDTLWLTNQASSVPQGRRGETPERFGLHQNFPNPFNSATTITYELPVSSDVQLAVYDILGRQVRVLVDERRNAGVHRVQFDAGGVASGVYIYRLKAGSYTQSRRLVVLR